MPPKTKKGKKKSKKQLERERQIELANIAAEEARQRELEIQRLKKLRAKEEHDLLIEFFSKEGEILNKQEEELKLIDSELEILYKNIKHEIALEKNWDKYLQCSVIPDPNNESDLNSFISVWKDEPVCENIHEPNTKTLEEQLPDIETILCIDILNEYSKALDEKDDIEIEKLYNHIKTIYTIINDKYDKLSYLLLENMPSEINDQSENFLFNKKISKSEFGLWGNITKNPRYKTLEFNNKRQCITIPKPIIMESIAIRIMYREELPEIQLYKSSSKEQLSIVGGILFLDLLELPEQKIESNQWMLQPVLSNDGIVKRVNYEIAPPEDTEIIDENMNSSLQAQWSIEVSYFIPPECKILDTATIMQWDPEKKNWDNDGVTDVVINIESGQIKFKTINFKLTALVQEKFSEYPIVSWKLKYISRKLAILIIQGEINKIVIEISDKGCKLKSPILNSLNENINGTWYNPNLLLMKLSQHGLNFRGPKSADEIILNDNIMKNPDAEKHCILGISQFLPMFNFRKCEYNSESSTSKIIFQFLRNKNASTIEKRAKYLYDKAIKEEESQKEKIQENDDEINNNKDELLNDEFNTDENEKSEENIEDVKSSYDELFDVNNMEDQIEDDDKDDEIRKGYDEEENWLSVVMDSAYILDEKKYKICYIVNENDLNTENNNENNENNENGDNIENQENVATTGISNSKSNTTDHIQEETKTGTPPMDIAIEFEEEHDLKHLYKFTPKKYEVMYSVFQVFEKITDEKVIDAIKLNRSILFENNLKKILHETGILIYN